MPYIGRTLGQGTRSRFLYTATAGQTTFSGSDTQSNTLAYSDNNGVDCFQNGVLLKGGGADYTATSGTSVVLTTGASVDDVIEILVYDVFAIADHVKKSGDAMTGALTNIDVNGTELILDSDGDTSITSDTDDQIDFKTGGSDRVTIDSTGNVGIGVNDPDATLDISGGTNKLGILRVVQRLSGASAYGLDVGLDPSTGDPVFSRIENDTVSESFRIVRSSGDILVGKTSNSNSGSGLIISDHSTHGGRISFTRINNTNTQYPASFYTNTGGGVGSISTTSTNTSFNTSSDYRLKENVVTDWDATTRLKQLRPSRFNFIADADTTVDGFLAHEVSSIVPEAISGEKDAVDADGNPEYQGIDQSKLVPLLTAALQEAITRIETLEAEVAALKGAN